MGDHTVDQENDDRRGSVFMKALLADLRALDAMLSTGLIESGVRRIGAEQEMFLVDRQMRPAPVATEVLKRANDPRLTTVLAAAVNSPLWVRQRLWQETRLALFQHSADARSRPEQARQFPVRVGFGEGWMKNSVLELFREDIARFRVILTTEQDEDPMEV